MHTVIYIIENKCRWVDKKNNAIESFYDEKINKRKLISIIYYCPGMNLLLYSSQT